MLLACALALLAGVAWLWLGADERASGRGVPPAAEEHASAPRTEPATLRDPPPLRAEAATRGTGEALAPFASARTGAADFAGEPGEVRGHVEVLGEKPFPRAWRLVARPSRYLAGREHAVERILEVTDGAQDFELRELPLGGYDLVAEAEGFNGRVLPVLLARGSAHAFVNLVIVPAGVLTGRVLAADGRAAEGVWITLFQPDGEVAGAAVSDARGEFRLEELPDGEYELQVGTVEVPLLPTRRALRFRAPRLTFPDVELPPLGSLEVRTVDSLARPLAGAEVRGSGSNGGLVEGTTDHEGRLVAHHLPPGRYRLRLEHPAFDASHSRRVAVDVLAGERAEAPVMLGP